MNDVDVRKAPAKSRQRGSRGAESQAVATITQRIRDGVYAPGQRLSEMQLSADLGLSRNTIREVLRRLASGGLITFEPNKGARVVRLDRQDVASLFQMREVVEGLAATLSATNINLPGHRDRASAMYQEIQAMKRLPSDMGIQRYPQHNKDFHACLMEMSCNKYLLRVGEQLNVPALRPSYFHLMGAESFAKSLDQHEEIITAVLDGDAPAAESAMRSHVRRTARGIQQLSDNLFSQVYGSGDER